MSENNFFESKTFGIILLSVAGVVVLVFVFGLGVFVGSKRADFSFKWAEAYHQNFGGPTGGFLGDPKAQEFTSANGVFGQIIKIDNQTLTINGKDNVEKVILIDSKTTIRFQKQNEKLSELKTGENIVVVGDPTSNGEIQAELIRIMPPMQAPANPKTN